MISQLLLDIRNSKTGKSFEIKDISEYNPNGPVSCGTIRVIAPGYSPKYYDVVAGFVLNINASNLGIQKTSVYDSLNELADGVYNIRYSINPNDKLFVEYVFFNTYKLNKLYIEKVCDFMNTKCDMDISEKTDRVNKLWEISNNIDLCKIAAEDCRNIADAELIYNNTLDLIKKL